MEYVEAEPHRGEFGFRAIGDEQVPNLTTELVARSAGAEALTPAFREPWGMTATTTPSFPALAQFDPGVGEPPDENRPPQNTRAHTIPRTWPGARHQVVEFLDPDTLGQVGHYCASAVCSAANPGTE